VYQGRKIKGITEIPHAPFPKIRTYDLQKAHRRIPRIRTSKPLSHRGPGGFELPARLSSRIPKKRADPGILL
jgi:hypothetical protein